MLAIKGWTAGSTLVLVWAGAVVFLITSTGALSGMGVIAKHTIFYFALFAPCVAGVYVSVRGRAPAIFWEAVADALFWGGIFAYPAVFVGGLVLRQVF